MIAIERKTVDHVSYMQQESEAWYTGRGRYYEPFPPAFFSGYFADHAVRVGLITNKNILTRIFLN